MQVILQQDVKGKGKKGQLIEAPAGYARNFLLPRGLAVEATAANLNTMKQQEAQKKARESAERAAAEETAEKLKGVFVKIPAKAGGDGRLFGSVTSEKISEALKNQCGLEIAKAKLLLEEPIKAYGNYQVKCRLGYEIIGTVHVLVSEG